MSSRRLTSTLATFVVALAACGGDEPAGTEATATESTPSMTKAREEYIARGDALCAEAQTEAADLARRAQELQAQSGDLPKSEFLERAAAFWAEQVRFTERFLREFRALGSPPGDEARVQEFFTSIEEGLALAREIQSTLERGQEVPSSLVEEYGRAVNKGNTLARAYGFEVCGAQG